MLLRFLEEKKRKTLNPNNLQNINQFKIEFPIIGLFEEQNMLWELSTAQLIVTGSFICCTSFLCGLFADKILGKTGFGTIGNWMLLLVGAYTGMYVYNLQGFFFNTNPTQTIFVVGGSGVLMLIFFMTLKRITRS